MEQDEDQRCFYCVYIYTLDSILYRQCRMKHRLQYWKAQVKNMRHCLGNWIGLVKDWTDYKTIWQDIAL